jgi:deaminated glutathione amidase
MAGTIASAWPAWQLTGVSITLVPMRAAAVQFSSGPDLQKNLARMEERLKQAAQAGAKLVAFPEHAALYAPRNVWAPQLARFGELAAVFSEWAKREGVYLLPGSLREPVPGEKDRFFNTALLFGPDGKQLASYRKLFLFRARLPDRVYDESEDCAPGEEIVTAPVENFRLGLAICYDLRFPELFRSLKKRGASVVALPSAFTVPTGRAHWDMLTRARAVENQIFLVAPGQAGQLGNGAVSYGHSRIVSPWGEVLAEAGDTDPMAIADLDPALALQAAEKVDAWASRREDLFPIA